MAKRSGGGARYAGTPKKGGSGGKTGGKSGQGKATPRSKQITQSVKPKKP